MRIKRLPRASAPLLLCLRVEGSFTFTFTWRPARCAYPARAHILRVHSSDAHAASARVCCIASAASAPSSLPVRVEGSFTFTFTWRTRAMRISCACTYPACAQLGRACRDLNHLRACAMLRPPSAHARARAHGTHTRARAQYTHVHTTAHTRARTAHYTRATHTRTRTQAHGHTSARVVVTAVVTMQP